MPETTDANTLIDQGSSQAEGAGTIVGNHDVDDLLTPQEAALRYDRKCPPPPRGAKKALSRRRKKAGARAIELLGASKKTLTKAAAAIRKSMR